MRRREFLASLGAGVAVAGGTGAATERVRAAQSTVDYLQFDSTASLVAPDGTALTDDGVVAVVAEDTATNQDADGDGDATLYDGQTAIPLAAVDGNVAGFGAQLVTDDANFRSGNEEFLLNVWDALVGEGGRVLFDESHDSYRTLSDFSNFARYADVQGDYTVTASTDLPADLPDADGVVISSPVTAFSDTELSALSDFVAQGGAVFCHDTADYQNFDETATLNDVAAALGVGFRFNDDQVVDETVNGGEFFQPTTDRFRGDTAWFADREGLEIDPTTTHTVDVVDVADGDTVDVRFDTGRREPIRVLGIDTPETDANDRFERLQEWEGIESEPYLDTWGANASEFAKTELAAETVEISFDDAEPGIFDPFGRLLAYVDYDATGDGTRDDPYNRRCVEEGYARLYSSSFSRHDAFRAAEASARDAGRGLWAESDPANTTEIRNRPVDELFYPSATAVRTSGGPLDTSRAPVVAESTATYDGGTVTYDGDVPLVGVDEAANLAVVGSPFVDESYEQAEDYPVDTSTFENFVFLTNLLDALSSTDGKVLIDGGHGQFGADFALSAEDTAYYQRYLEGVGIGFDQVNTLSATNLDAARALLITTPPEGFTDAELDTLRSFRDGGGAVLLLGAASATAAARDNLDYVSYALGSDLRVGAGSVTDGTNNVNADQTVPTTTGFDTSFSLFDAFTSESGGSGSSGEIAVQSVNADAAGNEYDNLNDEYVVFENPGSGAIELTGYAVEDAAGARYTFPDGFSLAAGDTVTLRTGSGTDTDTDLYWGSASPIWNNSGDTVYVFDDTGTEVVAYTY
ncbi:lamin tail domain-containing protein [Halobaculum sp. MBLA0147]|uniref:lamin tail domain-containing protein n=1 Tax=Halobaculum sp. MBLA0147 TaxID=3079934 RepID=UPI003525C39A